MTGRLRIWYWKPDQSRDMLMGSDFLKKHGLLPDCSNLGKTHVCISDGFSSDIDLGKIYHDWQGENWSPYGEARDFIKGYGLNHTSMSMGDIIQVDDRYYMVDRIGFTEL